MLAEILTVVGKESVITAPLGGSATGWAAVFDH
jgi:hypothetical protein